VASISGFGVGNFETGMASCRGIFLSVPAKEMVDGTAVMISFVVGVLPGVAVNGTRPLPSGLSEK
jgi:hypothetical protein